MRVALTPEARVELRETALGLTTVTLSLHLGSEGPELLDARLEIIGGRTGSPVRSARMPSPNQ